MAPIFVGGPEPATSAVANAILAFDALQISTSDATTAPPTATVPSVCAPGQKGTTLPLRVDTKYYTADLAMALGDACELAAESGAAAGCEAAVAVFDVAVRDAASTNSAGNGEGGAGGIFQRLTASLGPTLERLSNRDDDGPAVRLVVAINVPATLHGSAEHAQCEQWCMAHGFEFVVFAGDIACAADVLRGGATRDKDGIARVVEALQAHMWSNMVMKSRQGGGGGGGGGGSGGGGLGAAMGGLGLPVPGSSGGAATPVAVAAEAPPPPAGAAADGPRAASDGGSDVHGSASADDGPRGSAATCTDELAALLGGVGGASGGPDGGGGGGGGSGEDDGLGLLENLLREMQEVRASAAQLSDSDRRAAAAKTAMKLFAALELGGGGGGGGGRDGEEQEEGAQCGGLGDVVVGADDDGASGTK